MGTRTSTTMDLWAILMLLFLAAIWGGSFFFGKIAIAEVPPLTTTFHRVLWSVPLLAVIVLVSGHRFPRACKDWGAYLVMGLLNNAIPFSLIFWGQTRIDSGLASILNATTAMFAVFVAGLLLKDEPLSPKKIIGAALGIAGVAYIMGPEAIRSFNPSNLGQLAILGATLSYAVAGVWGRVTLREHPPIVNAFGMVTGSAILMLPVVLLVDGTPSLSLSANTWGALFGLSSLCTVLAYVLYFAILARAGVANLALVTLLIPPFAIALGALFLEERIGADAWVGFAIIALGFAVTDGRLARLFWAKRLRRED